MAKRTGMTFIQRSRQKGAAEKAAYHQETGVGKRRIKRPFLGLTSAEETTITQRVEQFISTRLRNV